MHFIFARMSAELLAEAARAIQNAQAVVVFAGAGMSADSGIPTYRGDNGEWQQSIEVAGKKYKTTELCTHRAFEEEYEAAWELSLQRLRLCRERKPHTGYYDLLQLLDSKQYFVVTSNIDSYFEEAGFDGHRIAEIHGSLRYFQCMDPKEKEIWLLDIEEGLDGFQPPNCPTCGGRTRPNVRFFDDWFWLSQRARDQEKRYVSFLKSVSGQHLLLLEIGAGTKLPYIRKAAKRLIKATTPLIRINPEKEAPEEHVLHLKLGATEALGQLKGLTFL